MLSSNQPRHTVRDGLSSLAASDALSKVGRISAIIAPTSLLVLPFPWATPSCLAVSPMSSWNLSITRLVGSRIIYRLLRLSSRQGSQPGSGFLADGSHAGA